MSKGPVGKTEINLNGERLVSSELLLDEIQTHVRYSLTYLRHLTRTGQIPATKWRGRWYYSPSRVLAALMGVVVELAVNPKPSVQSANNVKEIRQPKQRTVTFI
jgi:hypothetical protein